MGFGIGLWLIGESDCVCREDGADSDGEFKAGVGAVIWSTGDEEGVWCGV